MGIAVLTDDVRSELARLGRTDRIRKMKKGRTKDRARFLKEPFRFTKYLLGRERPGSLRCTKGEVGQYLRETHSDPERNKDLGPCIRNVEVQVPKSELDCKEP